MSQITNSTFKLPKIEELSPQRSQPYFSPIKDASPNFHFQYRGDKKQKSSGIIYTESDAGINKSKNDLYLDKVNAQRNKDNPIFPNSTFRQSRILKSIEEQRSSLQKKSDILAAYNNRQQSLPNQNSKLSQLNQILDSIHTPQQDSVSSKVDKVPIAYSVTNRSVNFQTSRSDKALPLVMTEPNETTKKSFDFKRGNGNFGALSKIMNEKESSNFGMRNTKPKFPALSPLGDVKYNYGTDRKSDKINIELILKIDEKIKAIFESSRNKQNLLIHLKEYLELIGNEEIIQVETLFFDSRVRKNLKTYIMLEKAAVFTLIFIISEEFNPKESPDSHIQNICHYKYSNFLNFIETLVSKIEVLPHLNQISNIDKVKQIAKRRVPEIDRSFSLEQINKLLLRTLKTSLKVSHHAKNDRFLKIDMLLEKIEFGLMLNYFHELQTIFSDLIQKYQIILPIQSEEGGDLEIITGNSKPIRHERNRLTNRFTGRSDLIGHSLNGPKTPEKNCLLPPPSKFRPGHENKPIYTLVLDMDETLIHFEEVAGKGRFFVRPYAEKFLKEMSELYEIIVFTAGVQDYADKVLDILDPYKYINHRLYRHHITLKPSLTGIVKDLSRLGRDLKKTIIIDNAPENFRLQEDNGIEILSWYNDPYDTELLQLMPFLTELVLNQVEDVTVSIKKLKERKRRKRY